MDEAGWNERIRAAPGDDAPRLAFAERCEAEDPARAAPGALSAVRRDTPVDSQGRKVNAWDFKRGTPVHVEGRLRIPTEVAGRPLDFSGAGLRIPVVHVNVASMLLERAPDDVQLIPEEIKDALERMGATGTRFEQL